MCQSLSHVLPMDCCSIWIFTVRRGPGFIVTRSILQKAQLRLRGVRDRVGLDLRSQTAEPRPVLWAVLWDGQGFLASHGATRCRAATTVLGVGWKSIFPLLYVLGSLRGQSLFHHLFGLQKAFHSVYTLDPVTLMISTAKPGNMPQNSPQSVPVSSRASFPFGEGIHPLPCGQAGFAQSLWRRLWAGSDDTGTCVSVGC